MAVTEKMSGMSLQEGGGSSLAQRDILCAEDNVVNRMMLSKVFKRWTFEFVGTGQNALQAATGQIFQRINIADNETHEQGPMKFRVIVLDFQMPSEASDEAKGGIEAAEKIREYERAHGLYPIPIYGFSSDKIPDDRRADLIGEGLFTNIFPKPDYMPLQLELERTIPSKV